MPAQAGILEMQSAVSRSAGVYWVSAFARMTAERNSSSLADLAQHFLRVFPKPR